MSRFLLLLILLMQLSGCSLFGHKDKKDTPTLLTYSLVATDSINPNISGNATPIEIQVFELEDDSMFLSADFDQLATDAQKVLKSNYLEQRDYVLLPGQFKFVEPFEVNKKTFYIGVMAHFADPNTSDWKKVVKIEPVNKQFHLLMYFNDQAVNLDKVE